MIRANSRMSSPWLLSSRLDCVTHNSMMLCSRKMRSDRKSTRLNSSHLGISYAVFCLKKKNIGNDQFNRPCLEVLAGLGVDLVALRSTGCNNVDVGAAKEVNLSVTPVPQYPTEGVAAH